MTVGKHVRTIQWDDRVSRWFYYCGDTKQYVRLLDPDGNELGQPVEDDDAKQPGALEGSSGAA